MRAGRKRSRDSDRQGFIGYVNFDGLQWRVMLFIRLEDESLWRARLWFAANGGAEVFDNQEFVGRSPEELLKEARTLSTEAMVLRLKNSYLDRRRYFALRAIVEELMERVRGLNRAVVRAEVGDLSTDRAYAEINRLQAEMVQIIEGLRNVAGRE